MSADAVGAMSASVTDESESRTDAVELTVVMPCLNEADTIEACVRKALGSIERQGIAGEVVIADNGSTDNSREVALALGARVVDVPTRGYGAALQEGIRAARGAYVIMGDADDSYDFTDLAPFVHKLREGYDLVMGCRLPSGGGQVMPGAMPLLHRWWGNPMFSWMARRWFKAPIHDVYCGLRGFSKAHYERLDQRCTGMEFATEMIIKSSLLRARITEVPVTLHPDGRSRHRGHLRTFRDGWRTLRFFLMYSPRWLFLAPGAALVLLGVLGYGVVYSGVGLEGVQFDAHTLLFASLSILAGYQAITFAVFAKTFAIGEGLLPLDRRMRSLFRYVTLERGILLGVAALLVGVVLLVGAILQWRAVDFGQLDYSRTMRWVIPGVTLSALGVQTVLSSFFLSILGMSRR
jgi:glycosyltransferase involved in cell wall biosynthesis